MNAGRARDVRTRTRTAAPAPAPRSSVPHHGTRLPRPRQASCWERAEGWHRRPPRTGPRAAGPLGAARGQEEPRAAVKTTSQHERHPAMQLLLKAGRGPGTSSPGKPQSRGQT